MVQQQRDLATTAQPRCRLHRALLMALLVILSVPSLAAQGASSIAGEAPQAIATLFPSATRIGERDPNNGVWPVYQLNELIGYAFESIEFAPLKGFSGEPVNLLIGLDTAGQLSGVKILHHHEPIFLHGLGEAPLLEFIDQYTHRSIASRFLLGKRGSDEGSVYLDGITKATVSVVVINDIILSSARQVARQLLPAFAQASPVAVKTDYFEPLQWPQLLDKGLVKTLHIAQSELEGSLGSPLSDFPDEQWNENYAHTDIFFAYLNAPIIGRNLLGERGYQALMDSLPDGEHAIALMSEGLFDYLEPGFQAATSPKRIGLSQNNLSISIRDMNFFSFRPFTLAEDVPQLGNFRIYRIRPQTGFNPGAPMQLTVNLKLQKNHLVSARAQFNQEYQLPSALFVDRPADVTPLAKPAWLRVWESRRLDTLVLIAALLVLSFGFAMQGRLIRYSGGFATLRWGFLLFTLLFIGIHAQGQLSVVNIFAVLLSLRDGFDIEVFLLDPIIFVLWIFTFTSLFIVGRGLFCGWLCPFGVMQELVAALASRLKIRQWTISAQRHQQLTKIKYFVLATLVALSFYSLRAAEQGAEVEPFKTAVTLGFIREWPFVLYALAILAVGLFINKFYCRYLCPLGAGLAVLGRFRRLEWLSRRRECGSPCQLCRSKCGVNAIHRDGSIDYDECIQCLECVVILEDPNQCAPRRVESKHRLRQQRGAVIATSGD